MSLRSKLERQSEEEKKNLEEEIIKISEKGKIIAINGLFIAGGLAVSYLLFKYFFENSKPLKTTKSIEIEKGQSVQKSKSLLGRITKPLAREVLILLLTMSKDKLIEYINKGIESNEEHTSRTAK